MNFLPIVCESVIKNYNNNIYRESDSVVSDQQSILASPTYYYKRIATSNTVEHKQGH